jgi:hypothetical protein
VQFLDGTTVIGTVATVFRTASLSTAGLAAGSQPEPGRMAAMPTATRSHPRW